MKEASPHETVLIYQISTVSAPQSTSRAVLSTPRLTFPSDLREHFYLGGGPRTQVPPKKGRILRQRCGQDGPESRDAGRNGSNLLNYFHCGELADF